jgi:hypothetical protein
MNPNGNKVDPDAVLDWHWNWGDWLATSESITTKTITVTEGTATVGTPSESGGIVTAFVSVPVADATSGLVKLRCRITTSAGRTDDRTIILIPEQR